MRRLMSHIMYYYGGLVLIAQCIECHLHAPHLWVATQRNTAETNSMRVPRMCVFVHYIASAPCHATAVRHSQALWVTIPDEHDEDVFDHVTTVSNE